TNTRGSCGRCWPATRTTTLRRGSTTRWCSGRPVTEGNAWLPEKAARHTRSTPERTGSKRSDRPGESLTNKVAPPHDAADPRAWANPMNERGLRVRFLPWSGSAPPIQQDRLRKCSLATLRSPNHPGEWHRNIHDNQVKANASKLRQGGHALGI